MPPFAFNIFNCSDLPTKCINFEGHIVVDHVLGSEVFGWPMQLFRNWISIKIMSWGLEVVGGP